MLTDLTSWRSLNFEVCLWRRCRDLQLPVIFRGNHQHVKASCNACHACHAFLASILGAVMVGMFSFGKTKRSFSIFLVFFSFLFFRILFELVPSWISPNFRKFACKMCSTAKRSGMQQMDALQWKFGPKTKFQLEDVGSKFHSVLSAQNRCKDAYTDANVCCRYFGC